MRVLVFGDAHIPNRAESIPPIFYNHIRENQFDLALITGDLVQKQALLNAVPPLPRHFIVRGNMDFSLYDHNHHELVHIGGFKALLLHGTQLRPRGNIGQLYDLADHVEADIAIHGHTHKADVRLYENKLFLNPGTITGANSGYAGRKTATMLDFLVEGWKIHVTLLTTDWHTLKESKISFEKTDGVFSRI